MTFTVNPPSSSNVVDFRWAFAYQQAVPDISAWDGGNGQIFFDMFARSTLNFDITTWDVSNAINMEYMFYATTFSFSQDLSAWNVNANNVDIKNMFTLSTLSCDHKNNIATSWGIEDLSLVADTCSPTHSPTPNPTSAPTQSPTNILQLIAIEEKSDNSAIVEITATFFGCMMVLIVSIIVVVYIFKRNKNDLYVDRKELCNDSDPAPSVSQRVIF